MGEGITYEEFTEKVLSAMDAYAGSEGRATLHKVRKNNGIELCGISIFREESNLSPTIYLETYYERYVNGEAFGELMAELREYYENCRCSRSMDISFYSDYEKVRGRLTYKLVNREKNKALLNEIPYIAILNLAVVFMCCVDHEVLGSGSILIRNTHMKMWQITTKTLYEDAMENAVRLFPLQVYPIAELLKEYADESVEGDRISENCKPVCDVPECGMSGSSMPVRGIPANDIPMYVMTNEQKLYGAGVILYPNVMKTMAAQLDSDLVILPSSVHEVIVLPVDNREEALSYEAMVTEINATQVAYEEVLSDRVYYYDRETQELVLAGE